MASVSRAKVDLGGFLVELPVNTPLGVQHAFELEGFIKANYPSLVCRFDKSEARFIIRECRDHKRWFHKRYVITVRDLKTEEGNALISHVGNILHNGIDRFNAVAQAGGSIIKLLKMPAMLQDQYIYRYIDLDGGIKSKKKEKAWLALKATASSGTVAALILAILAMV